MATPVSEKVVIGPAGGKFTVLTSAEEQSFNELCQRYTADNHFQNVSDVQDLERIIHMEVIHLRYSNWLSTETDYYGEAVNMKDVASLLKEFSGELRQLKKAIGIDRTSRQRDQGESVADYWSDLLERAAEFGVNRENQLTVALTLFNELSGLVTLHDNCLPDERKKLGCTELDILKWIRDVAIPKYEEVDRYFVDNNQKYWIQSQ